MEESAKIDWGEKLDTICAFETRLGTKNNGSLLDKTA